LNFLAAGWPLAHAGISYAVPRETVKRACPTLTNGLAEVGASAKLAPAGKEQGMSSDKVTMTEVEQATLEFVAKHRDTYLSSQGREGHVLDYRHLGGHRFTTTLLLETVGRKSGERRITPLIYGHTGGEVVVVASKGGADVHPAWYFNLEAADEVTVQIAGQAFRCTWREPEGEERAALWRFMADLYPPYRAYQAATPREIPTVCLVPGEEVPRLKR
jgi:deazaflavin-dependent oxidoreductase (nitroreductase family)